jgi:hypothetical protein
MRTARRVIVSATASVILCLVSSASSVSDVHTTRIAPAQEPPSVGYARCLVYPGGCTILDGESSASYGYGIGASNRAWVLWSLESIAGAAHVDSVEIELYIFPTDGPGQYDHYTQYRRMTVDPSTVPDGDDLYVLLQGEIYAQHPTGISEGLQRHVLGGSAAGDVEYQLAHGNWFSIGVTGDLERSGVAEFSGWAAGGPELIVTWDDGSPTEAAAWGRIKALYRS